MRMLIMLPTVNLNWLEEKNVTQEQYACLDQIITEKSCLFENNQRSWTVIKASVDDALVRLLEVLPAIKLLPMTMNNDSETQNLGAFDKGTEEYYSWIVSMIVWGHTLSKLKSAHQLMNALLHEKMLMGVGSLQWSILGFWRFNRHVPFTLKNANVSGWYYCLTSCLLGDQDAWLLSFYAKIKKRGAVMDQEAWSKLNQYMKKLYDVMRRRVTWCKSVLFFLPRDVFLPYEKVLQGFECEYYMPSNENELPDLFNKVRSEEHSVMENQEPNLGWTDHVPEECLLASYWEMRKSNRTLIDQSGSQTAAELLYDVLCLQHVNAMRSKDLKERLALLSDPKIRRQVEQVILAWCREKISVWVQENMANEAFILELNYEINYYIQWIKHWAAECSESSVLIQDWRLLSQHACEIFSVQEIIQNRANEAKNPFHENWHAILVKHRWIHESLYEDIYAPASVRCVV